MKIKEVIKRTRLPKKIIFYYAEQGIIHPKQRVVNQKVETEYEDKDVEALQDAAGLRAACFSIKDIREMQEAPERISIIVKECQKLSEQEQGTEKTRHALNQVHLDDVKNIHELALQLKELSKMKMLPERDEQASGIRMDVESRNLFDEEEGFQKWSKWVRAMYRYHKRPICLGLLVIVLALGTVYFSVFFQKGIKTEEAFLAYAKEGEKDVYTGGGEKIYTWKTGEDENYIHYQAEYYNKEQEKSGYKIMYGTEVSQDGWKSHSFVLKDEVGREKKGYYNENTQDITLTEMNRPAIADSEDLFYPNERNLVKLCIGATVKFRGNIGFFLVACFGFVVALINGIYPKLAFKWRHFIDCEYAEPSKWYYLFHYIGVTFLFSLSIVLFIMALYV